MTRELVTKPKPLSRMDFMSAASNLQRSCAAHRLLSARRPISPCGAQRRRRNGGLVDLRHLQEHQAVHTGLHGGSGAGRGASVAPGQRALAEAFARVACSQRTAGEGASWSTDRAEQPGAFFGCDDLRLPQHRAGPAGAGYGRVLVVPNSTQARCWARNSASAE